MGKKINTTKWRILVTSEINSGSLPELDFRRRLQFYQHYIVQGNYYVLPFKTYSYKNNFRHLDDMNFE